MRVGHAHTNIVGCIPTNSAWTPVWPCWEGTRERKQILRSRLCLAHTGFLFTIWACVSGSPGFLNFHFIVNRKPIQLHSQYGHRALTCSQGQHAAFLHRCEGWACTVFFFPAWVRVFHWQRHHSALLHHCEQRAHTGAEIWSFKDILFPEFGYNIYSFQ